MSLSVSSVFAVAVGGALGCVCRFGIASFFSAGLQFPVGTFSANMIGCFLIGLAYVVFSHNVALPAVLRLSILVGFLGGFTTFSSFGLESIRLIEAGRIQLALVYVLSSNLVGLALVYAGTRLGQLYLEAS
ncbi:MAG: fluoride efflux transporter CrcB [Myxococcota bacterium]|nr:fluoride efflux transporter CrcB [Myxococcota bacterium]